MLNLRIIALIFTLILGSAAFAQPRSITKIVSKSSIDEDGESKIQKYATGWAELLLNTDAGVLEEAHDKLASPFEADVRITPVARSLYGKYLKESFQPLLASTNENEMAAVNALQILSLLGTEQACGILLNHADTTTENRDALRLWSSIGLGTSFLTGELQTDRVERYAKLISIYISKEQKWFVLARQFDSIAAIQAIPRLDKSKRDALEELSFELQASSLVKLLDSIVATDGSDERVQALPFILPSILLQLIEPSVDEITKTETLETMLPSLIAFVEYAAQNEAIEEGTFLHGSYGGAAHSASLLITRALGTGGDTEVIELWNSGDYPAILELVQQWKAKQ